MQRYEVWICWPIMILSAIISLGVISTFICLTFKTIFSRKVRQCISLPKLGLSSWWHYATIHCSCIYVNSITENSDRKNDIILVYCYTPSFSHGSISVTFPVAISYKILFWISFLQDLVFKYQKREEMELVSFPTPPLPHSPAPPSPSHEWSWSRACLPPAGACV